MNKDWDRTHRLIVKQLSRNKLRESKGDNRDWDRLHHLRDREAFWEWLRKDVDNQTSNPSQITEEDSCSVVGEVFRYCNSLREQSRVQSEEEMVELEKEFTPDWDVNLHIADGYKPQGKLTKTQEVTKAGVSEHYNKFKYEVPEGTKELKIDPYFVSKVWGGMDSCLFHMLKNIARFGTKVGNSNQREVDGLYATLDRFCELNGYTKR